MVEVALWSVVDGLCAVEFWSVEVDGVVDGCADWSAGCDADGVVDCELEELGWLWSVCANVKAAPSMNVAKSVFFMCGYPLYCCKCIRFVLPAGKFLWTKSVAL
jgi:hypothetical protein